MLGMKKNRVALVTAMAETLDVFAKHGLTVNDARMVLLELGKDINQQAASTNVLRSAECERNRKYYVSLDNAEEESGSP